jgi:hypothetical protein
VVADGILVLPFTWFVELFLQLRSVVIQTLAFTVRCTQTKRLKLRAGLGAVKDVVAFSFFEW